MTHESDTVCLICGEVTDRDDLLCEGCFKLGFGLEPEHNLPICGEEDSDV